MYNIPQSISLQDKQFNIRNKGDFRMVLDCFNVLSAEDLTEKEKIIACLIIFYEDCNDVQDIKIFSDLEKAIKEMFLFFNCGQDRVGASTHYKLLDWEKDEQLICSAINKVSGKEIRFEPYIHWWTFMSYYLAIGDSPLSTVVSIRNKIAQNKKLEKYERDFRRENPQYFNWDMRTIEMKETDKLARELWNSNKK